MEKIFILTGFFVATPFIANLIYKLERKVDFVVKKFNGHSPAQIKL